MLIHVGKCIKFLLNFVTVWKITAFIKRITPKLVVSLFIPKSILFLFSAFRVLLVPIPTQYTIRHNYHYRTI